MPTFEDLIIWQEAFRLMKEIFGITKKFPFEEKYRLKDQAERSASSVCSNVAEGYSSYYYNDKVKGMYTARKEAGETQNHIRIMAVKSYISDAMSENMFRRYQKLIAGINGYVRYICEKRDIEQRNKPMRKKKSSVFVPNPLISKSPVPNPQITQSPLEVLNSEP